MKVELEKSFPMPASADVTWAFLQDIAAVAGCMPGAKITERLEGGQFKGTMTVKIGPATMSFRGDVAVRDIDPQARSLAIVAKGTDSTGTSGATMDLKARVEATGEGQCNLIGTSQVSMSGKAAAFGGRMMSSIAEQIMQQFATNFAAQVGARAAPGAAPGAALGAPGGPPPTAATGATVAGSSDVPPVASELNGLALLWAAFKAWLGGLFARKAT
jgi:carbon monoxide dehydrogenase subunit G